MKMKLQAVVIALALFMAMLSVISPKVHAQQFGAVYCSQSAFFDGTGAPTKILTGVAGSRIFICGYDVSAAASTTLQLKTGTGANCATGLANLTPAWNLVAGIGNLGNANFMGTGPVPPLTDVCVASAGAVQIMIYYTQQ